MFIIFYKKLNFKRLKKLLMHLFFMVVDGRKWKKKIDNNIFKDHLKKLKINNI